ncbi:MAG: [protein-PII] uridylyltransferase [Rhodospirillales bacterium]|nr:[protein-PII] uridylyltransferase [Rhodospirillales bacterium]
MYRIPHRRVIINRKALTAELAEQGRWGPHSSRARGNVQQIVKAALYRGVAEIRRRFEQDKISGAEVVHANAFLIDQLVRCIYDYACNHAFPPINGETPAGKMAVLATGGYGRGELFPFSDIDLMFLMPVPTPVHGLDVVEFILYALWDCGLTVGQATRTIDECVRLAKQDLTIRTSLLEARWLWGDRTLFEAFDRRFDADVVAGSGAEFVEAKLAERTQRHERMGDSRYVLEPNIKDGKGGLRDLQTLFWIAKYLYRVKDMCDLVERGVFTAGDVRQFRSCQNVLWNVRCQLHYAAGRPEERLTFHYQQVIADRLGYGDRAGARGVERFMKHYFRITKTVGDLTRILCAVLEEDHRKPRLKLRFPSLTRGLFRRAPAGFKLDGDRLTVDGAETFSKDPVKLLTLFREAQRRGLDIHPHALRLVQQNLRLIDNRLRGDASANQTFMEMLTDEQDPETTLKRLNEAGVFGRFIPDFGRVVAQMQYDMYHVYTVDEHTIRAIGILSRIEKGELREKHAAATAAVAEVRSRRVLYLAVLLHDVAKGRNGDHSELGAGIARVLAPRLGLDEWETDTVVWLVRYHLIMSRTAFKRDIDDPKTVIDFTACVQSPERLRMLLVLTNVDIAAVGPNIWNAWKESLLSELYYRTLEEMDMTGSKADRRREVRVEKAKAKLRARLSGWPEGQLEEFIARGYADYWLGFSTDEQARHFDAMRSMAATGDPLRVETRQEPTLAATEVTIYAPDHPGLFAQLTGAMALSGASIVNARIVTLANSLAVDVFYIQDLSGCPFDTPDRLERLKRRLTDAIFGKLNLERELTAQRRRGQPARSKLFRVAPRVIFDNKASAAATVIEVNGADRPGFLYDVTSTLTSLGLQIVSAHISTYGERVVDVFYVKDVFGLKIDQPQKFERLEAALLEAIEPPEETAVVAAEAAE